MSTRLHFSRGTPHSVVYRLCAALVVTSLLCSSLTPVANAQGSGPIYLPIIANGSAPIGHTNLLLRTHVTVQTTAQWRELAQLDVVTLDKGDDWALLLVDDEQLEALARWRYNPDATNALETLAATHADVRAAFSSLLSQLATIQVQLAAVSQANADATATSPVRQTLRAAMHALNANQLTTLTQAASVDSDNDGLSDDQESWWCTDPAKADSDSDGAKDGAEVNALRDWLNNKRATYPSSSKPFQGWPPQKTNCFDDDQDSVPDLAESLDLGLNPNRESTDRDKFDDGQELFGQTYCTGQGGFCSYGPLPRNEDWGVIFAEMPSWVKAPGNHPLVAAFPVPEVDVVASSLKVETVTEVTTDHVIGSGTEKSYSTAKTEGTSDSVANTISWNSWQEIGESIQQKVSSLSAASQSHVSADSWTDKVTNWASTKFQQVKAGVQYKLACGTYSVGGEIGGEFGNETGAEVGIPELLSINGSTNRSISVSVNGNYTELDGISEFRCLSSLKDIVGKYPDIKDNYQPLLDYLSNKYEPTTERANPQTTVSYPIVNNYLDTENIAAGLAGLQYSYAQGAQLIGSRLFEIANVLAAPVRTSSQTQGSSSGGSQTNEHTTYEEHTVTNSEAFSSEESWGTGTAINSAYAADLTFTYKVRNPGTEYAREIANLAFNLYIGDDSNPAYTYFVAPDIGGSGKFQNFMPNEEHQYTSRRIPLSLEQMKAIDLGGPIRIVVEDFTYGIDELFYQDAANAGVLVAIEDGTDDGNETIDTYLIPTWGDEKVLDVLRRYFPHATDANNDLISISTPEYSTSKPAGCQENYHVGTIWWCKHILSTADWWNVYTDGLGDGSEGFQDTPAVQGAVALFRFNKDTDLDGFSDRSEARLGTAANDASSFPRPEVLAGVHNIRSSNKVTATLSLLNTGLYDAYGVEAVMVAPDDSISITNNTVGGSGRVRALKQVIVGSRIALPALTNTPWSGQGHAVPAAGGYYVGGADRTYTFVVNCPTTDCTVGNGAWTLNWSDGKGRTGSLPFGSTYKSPVFQAVEQGLTVALYSGTVKQNESFTIQANTPRDTFQYTINREPHTEPLVIVSYNDPQGNHRFIVPSQAMSLTAPTADLHLYAGAMLHDVGVELVTDEPFDASHNPNHVSLLVNNPSDQTLHNAHLFLEMINISGTVVAEIPTEVTLPPGPTSTSVSFNTAMFDPPYQPCASLSSRDADNSCEDYIVMAFLTDYQGNILDTAGRPLSSFQVDPQPEMVIDEAALTWDFGTLPQGSIAKHPLTIANTGFGRLYTYFPTTAGITLNQVAAQTIGAADSPNYELTLRTAELPVGPVDRTITLATSDPTQPMRQVRIKGSVTAVTADGTTGVLQRPLDVPVTVTGTHGSGEWLEFTHSLGPDAQKLHPVKVYREDYGTLYGVGKYAADFGSGAASSALFGTGVDGDITIDNDITFNTPSSPLGSSSAAEGQTLLVLNNTSGFSVGDEILIYQVQGNNAGIYEFAHINAVDGNQLTLTQALHNSYTHASPSKVQVLVVPNYRNVTVTATGRWRAPAWDGNIGGLLVFRATGDVTVEASGLIDASARGFRGGSVNCVGCSSGNQGEGITSEGSKSRQANSNGGGGGQSDPSPSGGNGGASGGGGGGYGTAGSNGVNGQNTSGGTGGNTVGNADLTTIFMGGGGGAGGAGDNWGRDGGPGGNGGGSILIRGRNLTIDGDIIAIGQNGTHGEAAGGGGGGAGGTIYIIGRQVNLGDNHISALGGTFGTGSDAAGGNGGSGRIRIEYCESLNGSTNPVASTQKLDCYITEQVETDPYTAVRLALPTAVSDQATYNVQFSHKLDFTAAGDQLAIVRVPAGLLSTATFDLLVTDVAAGDLTFKVDIGNDGSWEWEKTETVTNAATFASDNLATAFNAYWTSHGALTTGTIDIPIRVSLSKAAVAFITNLQQLNLTASAGTSQLDATPLDVTVTLTGSHSAGEWVEFTHTLEPTPQSLHPVKIYSQNGDTLHGMGKYATDFGQGTASADMFGDGRDGVMPSSGNLDYEQGVGVGIVNSGNVGSTDISITDAYGVNRIDPGDVILIHQTQGTTAGCWELNKAMSDFGNSTATYQLAKPLKCNYISNESNKAQLLRVPQYASCNVTGTVTPLAAWNGSWGGIFLMMCNNSLRIAGKIDATATGYRGGTQQNKPSRYGGQGESYNGSGGYSYTNNFGGGGAGYGSTAGNSKGGGGGGYTAAGSTGSGGNEDERYAGQGGQSYGDAKLANIYLGSGGGAGGDLGNLALGGSGGGIVFVAAKYISVTGNLVSHGGSGSDGSPNQSSTGGAGGGAGGAVFIRTNALTSGTTGISAVGGTGGIGYPTSNGGNGSNGRIYIEYCNTLTGITNPVASTQKLDCYIAEQVETAPYTTVRLNLPESFSGGHTYAVQFGRKLDFAATGEQVTYLRMPASLYRSAYLDALLSGLPANASFALDVGNDGVTDWSNAVTNNSTNASPDLAAAFTAYWRSQGSPTAGTLDVPIKVTLDQPGQILLTNLRVETTGSRVRYVRLPVQNYATFHLDFTLGGVGAVAVDVGDNGSIDWSTTADTPRQETRDLAAVINAYLNGKSGMVDIPLRFYLSPDGGVTLNDYRATVNRTVDLIATQLQIGENTIQAAAVQTATVPADATVPVQATLRNGGNQDSGPVTAAFFARAEGWGDWYIGSAYIENLAAGAITEVSTLWDTTGFSGTLPVKVVVNPYGRVSESNVTNNSAQAPANVLPPTLPPTPDFTATPRDGSAPLTVVFTGTVTPIVPAVTSWTWNFGDGGTSNDQQPIHTYTAAGLYTVTLTIVTAAGTETKIRPEYIAVNVPPPPVPAFSATPTSGDAPLTVQFLDQSSADVTAWAWNFGDEEVSDSRQPSHTYTAAGVYTVTLTVTGPGGNATKTQPAYITVGTPAVTASIALTTGWNLVALPVQPVNPAIDQVLAPIAGKYTMVYAYTGCDTTDPWKKYDPAAPMFANDLTALQATQGFWIKVSTPASLPVQGSVPVNVILPLCAGWNLVGYPRQEAVPMGNALTPILACTEIVYAYVAADKLDYWKKYAPTAPVFANDLTELESGLGYWLKANAACAWPLQ